MDEPKLHYKLVLRVAVPCSMEEWAIAFESRSMDWIVAKTQFEQDLEVSTVFLGLDHGFGGPPLLFETMIFGEEHYSALLRRPIRESIDFQLRYSTWEEAESGHRRACKWLYKQLEAAKEAAATAIAKSQRADDTSR